MTVKERREKITRARLPLAIYRELAAHLQQVRGVVVEICRRPLQSLTTYRVRWGKFLLRYPADLETSEVQNLEAILASYADRYGTWVRESL